MSLSSFLKRKSKRGIWEIWFSAFLSDGIGRSLLNEVWYGLEDYETDLDTQSLKFLSFKLLLVASFRLFLWRGTHFACSDLWVMGMGKFHQGNVESEKGPRTGSCITVVWNARTREKPASNADKEGSEIPYPFPLQVLVYTSAMMMTVQ